MLKIEVTKTLVYGRVSWRPEQGPLRQVTTGPPPSAPSIPRLAENEARRAGTLVKACSETIEATVRRRCTLFPGFTARMEEERLPNMVMFAE